MDDQPPHAEAALSGAVTGTGGEGAGGGAVLAGGEPADARFDALTALLGAHRDVWEPRPFASARPGWAEAHPEVARWLLALDDAAVTRLEEAPAAAFTDAPATLRGWAEAASALAAVPSVAATPLGRLDDPRVPWRIPGRKWRQIQAFAAAAGEGGDPAEVVDWCAGKGHLGRTLGAVRGAAVTLVEHDARLRREALELAAQVGVDARFATADAHGAEARAELGPGVTAVALHACGGLLVSLLRGAVAVGVPQVHAAPCCYHRAHVDGRGTVPVSAAGRAAGLALTHSALRLATADEVVAPGRLRRGRRRENAWRLGLDELLREASGVDVYTPLGTLPVELVKRPFAAFCEEAAAIRGLALPASWDPGRAERVGWQRAQEARALGLVRGLFRGALELWLALDRALFLAEARYRVRIGRFCAREVTPRNLLISATRRDDLGDGEDTA
ncbi:MAG: methyltransferase [Deltaproteobacteria bacterium]|nr:methyltransferase [Deltaproteobacteria bacterium]